MLLFTIPLGGLLFMMGNHSRSESLFYYFRLEDQVPENHLLRLIDRHIRFDFIRAKLKDSYSDAGRPSIDPELLASSRSAKLIWAGARGEHCRTQQVMTDFLVRGQELIMNGNLQVCPLCEQEISKWGVFYLFNEIIDRCQRCLRMYAV